MLRHTVHLKKIVCFTGWKDETNSSKNAKEGGYQKQNEIRVERTLQGQVHFSFSLKSFE